VDAPLAHDESVVDGEAVDVINTAGLDRLVGLLVTREVSRRAGGGEGTRKCENDGALALEEIIGGDILPRERVGATNGLVTNTALEGDLGDGLTLLREKVS
jgi:hypothetical protein